MSQAGRMCIYLHIVRHLIGLPLAGLETSHGCSEWRCSLWRAEGEKCAEVVEFGVAGRVILKDEISEMGVCKQKMPLRWLGALMRRFWSVSQSLNQVLWDHRLIDLSLTICREFYLTIYCESSPESNTGASQCAWSPDH